MSRYRLRSRQSTKRSKLRAFLQNLPMIVAGVSAFSVALFYPPKPSSRLQQRVFAEGIHIDLDRTSPAFAAMEDVLLGPQLTEFDSLALLNKPGQVEVLEAGTVAGESLAQMIVRENHREDALMAQARASREESARLMAQAVAEAFSKMANTFAKPETPAPQTRSHQKSESTRAALVHSAESVATLSRSLAPAQISHPPRVIHLSELGLSQDELAKQILLPLATADVGDGPPIHTLVAGDTQYRTITSRRVLPQPKLGGLAPGQAKGFRPAVDSGLSRPTFSDTAGRASDSANGMAKSYGVTAESQETPTDAASEPIHQLVIGGPIEFTGGLALTNSTDRVIVYREDEGQMMESGAVWLKDGRYEIFVETAKGSLIAELRTPHGDILGRGVFDIDQLPSIQSHQYKVDSVALKIRPVPQGVVGQVISANSFGLGKKNVLLSGVSIGFENLPFEAVSLKDGRFEEPNLLEGSLALIKAVRAGHWNTLMFGLSGTENEVTLFPDELASAYTRVISPTARQEESGMIWGRVTRGGAPVQGATVDLLTARETAEAVYFNDLMMPDRSMTATGPNGLYAFYPVSPERQIVQATIGDIKSEPVLFPTEAKTVSTFDIEIQPTQKATVRVFDAFRTDWPLAAEVLQPGQTTGLQVPRSGEGELRYSSGGNLLMLDTDAGSAYERVRLSFPRDRRFIYLPMVQTIWIDRIRSSLRLNRDLHAGAIVGFIQGTAPYQVSMDEKSVTPNSKLVYFDSQGQMLREDYGVPGGGFILFNVPEGYRSVVIQPKGMTKTFASTVLVDHKLTNIINHWIR